MGGMGGSRRRGAAGAVRELAHALLEATPAPSRARRASRADDAVMWRTSPSRYSPVTTGAAPPAAAAQRGRQLADGVHVAAADVERAHGAAARASPVQSSAARFAAGDVAHVHEVAPLAAVLEDPRRLAALERRAEQRGDAGVRRVLRHPRARRRCGSAGPTARPPVARAQEVARCSCASLVVA